MESANLKIAPRKRSWIWIFPLFKVIGQRSGNLLISKDLE